MIGLVLVTHGRLADELRSAMEHVVGRQTLLQTVCIGPDDEIEDQRHEIEHAIDAVDRGDGVVLLTDMMGGTPCNLARSMTVRPNVAVIAGVNLPMLVKLGKIRGTRTLAECVDMALAAGRKYIANASSVVSACAAPRIATERPGADRPALDGMRRTGTDG